jgi:hypothetical protein
MGSFNALDLKGLPVGVPSWKGIRFFSVGEKGANNQIGRLVCSTQGKRPQMVNRRGSPFVLANIRKNHHSSSVIKGLALIAEQLLPKRFNFHKLSINDSWFQGTPDDLSFPCLVIFFEELVRVLLPHRFDPIAMLDVPLDCLFDRALEGVLGLPAEFLDLGRADRAAEVMSKPRARAWLNLSKSPRA